MTDLEFYRLALLTYAIIGGSIAFTATVGFCVAMLAMHRLSQPMPPPKPDRWTP